MTRIAFLRHAATSWNLDRRLQGRRDIPLTEESRAALAAKMVPDHLGISTWMTSPLARAKETAAALGLSPAPDPRLVEMDWGEWEGCTLKEVRANHPNVAADEARGFDFRPPSGESPREVAARVSAWAVTLPEGATIGALTHKGVIRAALALALPWDMRKKEPVTIDWQAVHLLTFTGGSGWAAEALNIPLDDRPVP